MRTPPLTPAARAVLQSATVVDNHVTLPPGQLDRKLYKEVDMVLARLGGKWNRHKAAHVFPPDTNPHPALAAVLADGVMPVDQDKVDAFFRTPPEVAARMVVLAGLEWMLPGARVLEPSAGDGALAHAILTASPSVALDCVEPDAARAKHLTETVSAVTFLGTLQEFTRRGPGTYAAVVMNPPFTEPGDPVAWATHVLLAWDLLALGGTLVAVIPRSLSRAHRTVDRLREVARAAGRTEFLPDGAFKASGTDVRCCLLTLHREDA